MTALDVFQYGEHQAVRQMNREAQRSGTRAPRLILRPVRGEADSAYRLVNRTYDEQQDQLPADAEGRIRDAFAKVIIPNIERELPRLRAALARAKENGRHRFVISRYLQHIRRLEYFVTKYGPTV